jgi:hypothetical protein
MLLGIQASRHPGIHAIISSPTIIMRMSDILKCDWRELFFNIGISFIHDMHKRFSGYYRFQECGTEEKRLFLECIKASGVAMEEFRIDMSARAMHGIDDDYTIGKNIERLMMQRSLYVEQFADRISEYIKNRDDIFSRSHICADATAIQGMINNPKHLPSESFICLMAKILNYPCMEFFFRVPLEKKLGFGSKETIGNMKATCLRIEARIKEGAIKMSENSTIMNNIAKAIKPGCNKYSRDLFYYKIYSITGWKHESVDLFSQNNGSCLWIGSGGREDETAKILVAASEILEVNVMNFFQNVEMNESRVKVVDECYKLMKHKKSQKEMEEKEKISDVKREKELKEKAEKFVNACKNGKELCCINGRRLNEYWKSDTSFLQYVSCLHALKYVMKDKPHKIVEELLELKEFKNILTDNDNEILKHAIHNVLTNRFNDIYLREFCIIATTKEVREAMYYEFSDCYAAELCIDNHEVLKSRNVRDMLWLVEFFTNNNPQYDTDNFNLKYKDALLKEILG